jgi:hypothetical protein
MHPAVCMSVKLLYRHNIWLSRNKPTEISENNESHYMFRAVLATIMCVNKLARNDYIYMHTHFIMALGSTHPLTEMSTRNIPGGKMRAARKPDNLAAICEPIV